MAILQVKNKLRKWSEYMQELFRYEQRDVLVNKDCVSGPPITI